MGRSLMRITPSIVAASREYLQLKRDGHMPEVHVADCFPLRPEAILEIWETALRTLCRGSKAGEFELAYVAVFKDNNFAAEYLPIEGSEGSAAVFG